MIVRLSVSIFALPIETLQRMFHLDPDLMLYRNLTYSDLCPNV